MSIKYYLNCRLKLFEDDLSNTSYYNLSTNRRVSTINGLPHLLSPKVRADNYIIIAEFMNLNHLNIEEVECIRGDDFVLKECIQRRMNDIETFRNITRFNINNKTLMDMRPFELFSRRISRAIVTRVIDGDTIEAVMNFTTGGIMEPYINIKTGLVDSDILINGPKYTLDNSNLSIIMFKLKIRLAGIDTAEKDTELGQDAKKYAISLYSSTNNIIYIQLLGVGARGRAMGRVYMDSELKKNVSDLMLGYTTPDGKKVAYPYFGGKKDEEFHAMTHNTERGLDLELDLTYHPIDDSDDMSDSDELDINRGTAILNRDLNNLIYEDLTEITPRGWCCW